MKVTVLFVYTFLGMASAGQFGHHHGHGHNGPNFSQNSGTASSFGDRQPRPSKPNSGQQLTVDGIVLLDNHQGIFRSGVFQRSVSFEEINKEGYVQKIFQFQGTGIFDDGKTCPIDEGIANVREFRVTDRQALQTALSRTGMTLDQFDQQTGTMIALQQSAFEVISGTMLIHGVLNNILAGVYIITSVGTGSGTGSGIGSGIGSIIGSGIGTGSGIGSGTGSGNLARTVTVTETAAFETRTVVEPVTLIKTQTIDQFETVTAPNYASILVSVTDIVKQTVTVTEEEVIRSTGAGSIVVNTVPVPSKTVLKVQARTTNYFVRTVNDQVSLPQTHFVTIHSIRTNTVNNPATSTITQVISQTRVSTVYKTSVVGSTVYTTSTTIVTIGTGGGSTTVPAGYY